MLANKIKLQFLLRYIDLTFQYKQSMFKKEHQRIKKSIIPIEEDEVEIIADPKKKRKLNESQNKPKQISSKPKQTTPAQKKIEVIIDCQSDGGKDPQKQIQLSEAQQDKKVQKQSDFGFIKFESIKKNDDMATKDPKKSLPWLRKSTMEINEVLFRFHNEIIDFYEYIRPSKKQHKLRLKKLKEIEQLIHQEYPQANVATFGSFTTKLYLPESDIDVAVIIQGLNQWEVKDAYDTLYRKFLKYPEAFTKIEYLRKTKVPLIKFVDGQHGIQFDVSVNKADGIEQIQHIQLTMQRYPEFKYLVFVFKCALKIRNLSETYTGGVGSFLLYAMILVFLRQMHNKQKNYMLSEYVLRFMEYWGMGRMDEYTVLVQNGQMIRRDKQPFTLSLISPQDPNHDIGKAAYNSRQVIKVFRNRFRYITNTKFAKGQSILKQLINPAQEIFRYYQQIQRLRDSDKKQKEKQNQNQ